MNTPTLSVHIPIYNGEKYLRTCLDSVLNQTFGDFELFLHNDGSSDGSYDICREYAEKDNRIHLSTSEHGTYISCKNWFLEHATGEYIGFVDCDDFLEPVHFERMISALRSSGADYAISGYTLVDSKGDALPWYTAKLPDGEILSGEDVRRRFLTTLEVEGFVWNKICKRSIYLEHNIRFSSAAYPEDIHTTYAVLSHVDKAVLVGSNGYYYRQSDTSEIATMNMEKRIAFLDTYDRIAAIAMESGLVKEGDYYRTWRMINFLFNSWKGRRQYTLQ